MEIAEEFQPHAIALDVSLPTMTGFDVATQLRHGTWGTKTVLVAVTGWSQKDARARALDAGFDDYVVKPVNPSELLKMFEPSHAGSATP